MTELLTADQVRDRLRKACEAAGGLRAWARGNGVSAAWVSRVIRNENEFGDAILVPLGVKKTVTVTYAIDEAQNVR